MSNRHLSRTIALQTLFEWDFNSHNQNLTDLLERNLQEFAPGFDDQDFAKNIINGIIKNQEQIDQLITTYAPEWPLDQITPIDRNTLRVGIFELRYCPEIPPKVAINESIELAKNFSGQSSGKFVNGVLGSIFKAMQAAGEKKEFEQEPQRELSCGGIVHARHNDKDLFVLVLDGYNKWTFPKGKIEPEENMEQAAIREVGEEIGIKDLTITNYIGNIDIKVSQPNKMPTPKTVHYFTMETEYKPLELEKHPGILDGQWVTAEQALTLISYENAKEIFTKALSLINK